jgi:hypothetical protein
VILNGLDRPETSAANQKGIAAVIYLPILNQRSGKEGLDGALLQTKEGGIYMPPF